MSANTVARGDHFSRFDIPILPLGLLPIDHRTNILAIFKISTFTDSKFTQLTMDGGFIRHF